MALLLYWAHLAKLQSLLLPAQAQGLQDFLEAPVRWMADVCQLHRGTTLFHVPFLLLWGESKPPGNLLHNQALGLVTCTNADASSVTFDSIC